MPKNTKIEWAEDTWNPLRGCSRVSEGCRHCYAERIATRFGGYREPYEGLARFVTRPDGSKEARWTGVVLLVEDAIEVPLRWRRPRRIFVNSMSDLFHELVTDDWLDRIFGVMALAPRHQFLVLTKRPERMREYMSERGRLASIREASAGLNWFIDAPGDLPYLHEWGTMGWPLPNVWLGVSCEDQATANERIPILLDTPAAARFMSAEPLLGPINLTHMDVEAIAPGGFYVINALTGSNSDMGRPCVDVPHLDWVIVGGESGPGARACSSQWLRSIVQQCQAAGVPCFVKQVGANMIGDWWGPIRHPKGGDPAEWPDDLRVREMPDDR